MVVDAPANILLLCCGIPCVEPVATLIIDAGAELVGAARHPSPARHGMQARHATQARHGMHKHPRPARQAIATQIMGPRMQQRMGPMMMQVMAQGSSNGPSDRHIVGSSMQNGAHKTGQQELQKLKPVRISTQPQHEQAGPMQLSPLHTPRIAGDAPRLIGLHTPRMAGDIKRLTQLHTPRSMGVIKKLIGLHIPKMMLDPGTFRTLQHPAQDRKLQHEKMEMPFATCIKVGQHAMMLKQSQHGHPIQQGGEMMIELSVADCPDGPENDSSAGIEEGVKRFVDMCGDSLDNAPCISPDNPDASAGPSLFGVIIEERVEGK